MTSGADTPEATSSYRWTILAVALGVQVAAALPFLGVGVLAGFLQERYDLSGTETGLLVTAIGIVPLFALIPVGRFLDHHSERVIITAGPVLLGVGVAMASFVDSYLALLGIFAIAGAGYATSQPGGGKVVAAWFPGRERGLAMGIRQTGVPLAGAIAAATLPQLADRYGVDVALLSAAGAAIAGGLVFFALYRPAPMVADSDYRLGTELWSLLSQFRIRTAMWTGLAMVGAQFALLSYLMLYLRDVHDIPLARGAWVLFVAQMSGVAGRVVLARWSDRLRSGRQVAVLTAIVASAVGAFVLAVLPAELPLTLLVVLAVVVGFWAFGWYGPWVVLVAETAPRHAVGLTLGLAITANQLGIVAAPPLFGLVLDVTGTNYHIAWATLGVALLLTGSRAIANPRRPVPSG